jgi:antitoxin (DNA-binding transcriptional repressor) of toxin-antitoxin stability system
MVKVNIHEAKTHLSRHLERLEKGEEDVVVICRRNDPIAEIRALPKRSKKRRPIGLGKGTIKMTKAFFDPLPDDLLRLFNGEEEE